MTNESELRTFLKRRFFSSWDGFVSDERIQAAEACMQSLLRKLIAMGLAMTEESAREAVRQCVQEFNDIDAGWICTIEREEIYTQIGRLIRACGFTCREDWLSGRNW